MPRGLVALFALLEALFVVALGIAVPFLVGIVGWASLSGFRSTPADVWQVAVQAWAIGHGIPLHVALGDSSAVLAGELATFDLSVAPFAFAIVTALLGRRAGRRLSGSDDATLVIGLLVAFVAALAALVLVSGQNAAVTFDVPSGTIRILAPFVVGLIVGWKPWERDVAARGMVPEIPDAWRDVVTAASRIALATVALLVAVSSFVLVTLVVLGFATEIALYESLHTGVLGGFVITVAQIALIPVAIVWMMAWIAGPGFILGAGAVVSPFVTTVGAVPAIPLLGAIPASTTVGWWVTLVPGVLALIAGARFGVDVRSRGPLFNPGDRADLGRAAITAVAAGVTVAIGMMTVGTYASGSAGPGRFAQVGIDPVQLGLVLAAGVALGSFLGVVAGKIATDSERRA